MIRRLILFSLLMIASVVVAQERSEPAAQGIIHIPRDNNTILDLNPLFCQSETCDLLSSLMFPSIVATNPNDDSLQLADETNFALLADYELSADGDHYIYTLRDDATWSDGNPITAYDVFFSYLAMISHDTTSDYSGALRQHIQGMIPLGASRLMVIPDDIDCDLPRYANFPVIPAHVFDDDFASRASNYFTDDNLTLEALEDWIDDNTLSFREVANHPFSLEPTVTYGRYTFGGQSAQDYVRLVHVNGQQVIETTLSQRGRSGIDDVIAGDIAYYENPPQIEWADLRNNPDVNTVTLPTNTGYFLAFNFADPREPLSYRDRDGEIQEQVPHPALVNHDVRRAIQMSIDVQAIVDEVLYGEGEVMAGYSLPTSWTHNPDLSPMGYDPDAAADILEAEGWRRINRTGARVCIDCETADDETRLALRLSYDNANSIDQRVAANIANQLRRINIDIELDGNGLGNVVSQQFDLYLGHWDSSFPIPADNSWFFSPEDDFLNGGINFGSYNNPDVTALFNEARTLDGCNIDARRDLYYELEQRVQADLPYAWLFTPYQMTVFHNSIQNVETYPNRPLVNLHEWSVWRMP